ncbi:IS3 family transposase [Sulfurimonas sp. MAG313]|nr:IS3 family transposase [Sulfurimonas sp. MAG313]MDF1881549.1 IS3 family transposase [Sulfurimonas sp. MAG313]
MSRTRKVYTTAFKTKLVLEVLRNERPLEEIAIEHEILKKNLQNWQATFLANAEIAMEPAKAVKEYKEEIKELQDKNDEYAKTVGQITVENNWMRGKLNSLDSINKKTLIESKLTTLSISKQCELISLNRGSLYRTKTHNIKKESLMHHIKKIHEEIPIYGAIKVYKQLLEEGAVVSLNTVEKYFKEAGYKAILAVKLVNTTIPIKEHKKYPYALRGLDINHANQVWSTDITYIKIAGGMVYLAAVIDWYSKAILSYRISNTMDTALVMDVLNEALFKYDKPEIFNTDQGSQYTSLIHTQRLKDMSITISMDGKGRATDNIAIERFWRSAKCECIYLNEYHTIKELKEDLKDYMNFYNYKRFHQTLDYKKPMNVYYESLKINMQEAADLTENVG